MNTSHRGFIVPLLLIIIALLAAGGGAYVYEQMKPVTPSVTGEVSAATSTVQTSNQKTTVVQTSNSQIADWQTYSNTEYGFEFKYPAEITLGGFEKKEQVGDMPKFTTFWIDYKSDKRDFLFAVLPVTASENIAEYRQAKSGTPVTIISLGGNDWYRFDERLAVQYDQYYLEKNGNLYRVDIYDSQKEHNLKKILATFKFTSPNSQTAGLKKYINSQYGLEFKYPATWVITETSGDKLGLASPGDSLITLTSPSGSSKITFIITLQSGMSKGGNASNVNCPASSGSNVNSVVSSFHLMECKNIENPNGLTYARAIRSGMSTTKTYNEQTLEGYFLNSQEQVDMRMLITDAAGNVLPSTVSVFDSILQSFKLISSGTPITLTTIDICSPLLKDASTLFFTDKTNKVWTVNYSKATFTNFSKISKTVLSTNLQDWLKSLYRVGGPQSEICGAPGMITITGTFDGTTVFASHIELSGQ